jgi:hypothetical protein
MRSLIATPAPISRRAALLLAVAATGVLAVACNDDSKAPNNARIAYGASQVLGNGTARTYVSLNAAGQPVSIGVALSEAALNNLPMTPNAPSPSVMRTRVTRRCTRAGIQSRDARLEPGGA